MPDRRDDIHYLLCPRHIPFSPVAGIRHVPGEDGMKTVLLVEDNREVLVSTAYMLQDAGYEVVAAANSDQAKQVASVRTDIGVVLADLNLSEGMNGIELGMAMREDGLRCPLVLMSGEPEPPEDGLLSWMSYLPKPFDSKSLLAAITGNMRAVAL
jgi:DNA-binding response OmpR family regulator